MGVLTQKREDHLRLHRRPAGRGDQQHRYQLFLQAEENDESKGLRQDDQDSEENHSQLQRKEIHGDGDWILCPIR